MTSQDEKLPQTSQSPVKCISDGGLRLERRSLTDTAAAERSNENKVSCQSSRSTHARSGSLPPSLPPSLSLSLPPSLSLYVWMCPTASLYPRVHFLSFSKFTPSHFSPAQLKLPPRYCKVLNNVPKQFRDTTRRREAKRNKGTLKPPAFKFKNRWDFE